MKNKSIFTGAATALITPMTEKGIDYDKFGRLIDWQIDCGIDALVICGTTGESATMTEEEHKSVMKYAVGRINGRVPAIIGTGSNDTRTAVEITKYACDIGGDAVLLITPYYNKATQAGLIKSFYATADASTKPVIIYNVPSRTGVSIEPKTYVELAKHPNITAVKEACGNMAAIAETFALVGDSLDIYSGSDEIIVPILALGGKGVISVLSNVAPKETSYMCKVFFEGDIKKSAAMQLGYLPLINALFSEVNPIPVKAAMAKMGFCEEYLRLPLTNLEEKHREILFGCMKNAGILK